jgi:N-acetylglucosamine kinase-like BadF-type ATPase
MPENYFLGIDGGQTSTLVVLCNQDGVLLGTGHSGPSNHVHEPGGMARLEKALLESTRAAFQEAGFLTFDQALPQLEAACFGMTGGVEVVADLFARQAVVKKLIVHYDVVTAHAGALVGEPGVIVIGGTGSVAYGKNRYGETARSGGWAYLMGDEGSGYDLGRRALVAAARAEDGRGPSTCLLPYVLDYFKKNTLWEVRNIVYSGEIDRAGIAQLSHLVISAVEDGDRVAKKILTSAARELSDITVAVLRKLGMEGEDAVVSTIGGVFQAGKVMLAPFGRYLHREVPRCQIRPPVYQPVIGAVLLALRAAGIQVDGPIRQQLDLANRRIGNKG